MHAEGQADHVRLADEVAGRSSEMTTVLPAKSTDRPEVMRDVTTASRGSRPSKMPCR